ncbi:MAG TPA: RNA polymerase sigma factor [Phycisphaerae bacterium]|nr:RNA polymerase sigma factor [Phycisphaerae bacterium]
MTYDLKPSSDSRDRPVLAPGLSPQAGLEDLRRRLVRYAVRLVWNRDDAEEMTQEAFRLAVEKKVTTADAKFGPWLFRTVSNLCLNARRRRQAEPLLGNIEPMHGESAEVLAQHVERLERLRNAVDKLPAQQRVAIVLRSEQQMSYDDIAGVMEISESAARGHVHLARKRLIELIGE